MSKTNYFSTSYDSIRLYSCYCAWYSVLQCRKSFSNYQVILSVYQIISFYFEYLERVKFADNGDLEALLNQLEAPKIPFVLFVLNDNETTQSGGTHWSLLVFSRLEK